MTSFPFLSCCRRAQPAVSKFAIILSLFVNFSPFAARADLVRVEAIGIASYVNEYARGIKLGAKAQLVLTYDTEAAATNIRYSGNPVTGKSDPTADYGSEAVIYFQIFDESFNPLIDQMADPQGTIWVNDRGATGDDFSTETFPRERYESLKLTGQTIFGGFFTMRDSTGDTLSGTDLPKPLNISLDEFRGESPLFSVNFCVDCHMNGPYGRAVSFKITHIQSAVQEEAPVAFSSNGTSLIADGVIDASTLDAYAIARATNATATRLDLPYVPGSDDDDANLVLSHQVRKAGLTTNVPTDGLISSGGVDLFLAGTKRTLSVGACVGVHSWEGGGIEGKDLPRDDEEHHKYLKYFNDIGISHELYWFTLRAAPANGMHWMTQEEVDTYDVATEPAPVMGTHAECEARHSRLYHERQ